MQSPSSTPSPESGLRADDNDDGDDDRYGRARPPRLCLSLFPSLHVLHVVHESMETLIHLLQDGNPRIADRTTPSLLSLGTDAKVLQLFPN